MKDALLLPCLEGCGQMVNVTDGNPWAEWVGVARKREQGGMNDLTLKRPTGRFMCETCVTNGKQGLPPGQTSLL